MRLRIRERPWALIRAPVLEIPPDANGDLCAGLCDSSLRVIWIDESLKAQERLRVEVHELLHAIDDRLTEAKVGRLSRELAAALHRMGYQCPK